MNNKNLFFLFSVMGQFFVLSNNVRAANLSEFIIENSKEFVVTANQVRCYQDDSGSPNSVVVKIFHERDRVFPQRWENWSPYVDYNNRVYLWTKFNNSPGVGCFIEATTANISPINQTSSNSSKVKCIHQNNRGTRYLETTYTNFPSKLPCRVVYFKENGTTQVIANAKNTEGYCENKRQEFLKKLRNWGWYCQ